MAERRRYSDEEVALARSYLERGIAPTSTEARALTAEAANFGTVPMSTEGAISQAFSSQLEAEPQPAPGEMPFTGGASGPGFQVQRPEPVGTIPGTEALLEPVPHQGLATRIAGTDIQSPYSAATIPAPAPRAPAPAGPPMPAGPPAPAAPRARGGVGMRAPSGPPAWLRQEMGDAAEGTVQRKPGPIVESITPEEAGQLGEAEDESFAAAVAGQEAEEQGRLAERRAVQASLDREEEIEADLAVREQQRQQQLRAMESDFRTIADEIAATPIDSNRIWNNKSTGEKILSKIALAVSTFGFGVAGVENPLLGQMEAEIERDIEAQKANKALQQSRLAAEGTLIGMARDRFASEAAQDAIMREVQYRKVAQQLEQFRDFTKDPQRRAAMDQALAEWNMKLTEAERQRRIATETDELTKRRIAAAAAARPDPLTQLIKTREKQAKLAGLEREIAGTPKPEDAAKLTVAGRGIARDEKSAQAARDLEAANSELLGILDEAKRLRGTGATKGVFGVGTQAYKDAQALRDRAVPVVAKINAGGFAPSETDMSRAEDMVPDPTSWSDSSFEAKQKALRTGAKVKTESAMRQYIRQPDPRAR